MEGTKNRFLCHVINSLNIILPNKIWNTGMSEYTPTLPDSNEHATSNDYDNKKILYAAVVKLSFVFLANFISLYCFDIDV